MTIRLNGITWDHPRGAAPLFASVDRFKAVRPDVEIVWTVRSLRDFGELPLEGLAERFDMIVFDHPFVGQAHKLALLTDLAPHISREQRAWLDAGALGPSWTSYQWAGGVYGLPIDAAAHVAAWRPDLLAKAGRHPPATFAQLLRLARDLREHKLWVAMTGCPTDAICHVLTLAANDGCAPPEEDGTFLRQDTGLRALERLKALAELCHPDSLDRNPIQTLDAMSTEDEIAYVPYTFGYANYSRVGSAKPVRFGDIVAAGAQGPTGTLLGGAGFGVTARCADPAAAGAYGLFLCHPDYQRTHYLADGGQPGMLQAWEDPACDAATGGFFSSTLRTLTSAYLRPRLPGFVPFFEEAGKHANAFLRGRRSASSLLEELNAGYAKLAAEARGT